MSSPTPTLDLLEKFARGRPGFDPRNYGDVASYRSDSRTAQTQLKNFTRLLAFAHRFCEIEVVERELKAELSRRNGRLSLKGDSLEYVTGQYYPTEFRGASVGALWSAVWAARRIQVGATFSGPEFRKFAAGFCGRWVISW